MIFIWENGDNGNVYGITNNRDTTRSQSFSYDALNRLLSAQNAGTDCTQNTLNGKTKFWGNSYGYDPWGNLLQKTPTKCGAENLSVAVLANNQLSGYGYDAAGNMTHDATTGNNYSYDPENRLTGAAGFTYGYDAEDQMGLRYYSNQLSRFTSADLLGGLIIDPQTLNRYTYARNNPLRYTDPTGMYLCADSGKCDSKQDKAFEKARLNDLKSKDPNVVRGAQAYGDPTKDNDTTIKFGDPGKGNDGITTHSLGQDPNDPNKIRAVETVTIKDGLSGSALDAALGHEGSHVADAQDFAASITAQGGFDASKNLSKYETEFKAYLVTQSIMSSENEKRGYGNCGAGDPCALGFGVSPAQARETINRLLANPANNYGGITPQNPGPTLYPSLTTPK